MRMLNLKRLLKKRNNGGFTLIEVVISCALLGILVLGICTFATPVMNSVSRGKANARATLFAETIDTYLAGILKNAKMVEVMQYTTLENANSGLKGATDADKGLNNIISFMSDATKSANYEVRCLGISWINDSRAPGKRKLMLTNNTVDASNDFKITGVSKIFDDVIYNQLYPIITLETFGEVMETSSTSSTSSTSTTSTSEPESAPESEPEGVPDPGFTPESIAKAGGYKISIVVYSDQNCYNAASNDERLKSRPAFRSASFVKCLNMSGEASDVCLLATDLQTAITNAVDGNYPTGVTNASTGTLKYTEGEDDFFYPDTYIYYVVPRKTTT